MEFTSYSARPWKLATLLFLLIALGALAALIYFVVADDKDDKDSKKQPNIQTCGDTNPNGNVIDLREPEVPGPFHDLTVEELKKIRTFLEQDPNIHIAKTESATATDSYLYTADIFLAKKNDILNYLDNQGPAPIRQARVMVLRGDLSPPDIQEYICGPLPDISNCTLMNIPGRRNPVQYSLRPYSLMEFYGIYLQLILPLVEHKLATLMTESFGMSFLQCDVNSHCLTFIASPVGTALTGTIESRRVWLVACYPKEFVSLHPLPFALLMNLDSSNSSDWTVEKTWYAGRIYDSLDNLAAGYSNGSIPSVNMTIPEATTDHFGTSTLKGQPWPRQPQRPPTLVEPDGKRYSIRGRKVEYMDWTFHFRNSPFTGLAAYDIRFQGQRIVFELALQEIAVFYNGYSPHPQTTDFVDSYGMLGIGSKTLVPGIDCPDTATFINQSFIGQVQSDPGDYQRVLCIFEQNSAMPLRRHASYSRGSGGFVSGMMDSALVLRSIITAGNYDYVVDYIFHQNGAVQAKFVSTGYIVGGYYTDQERSYSYRLEDHLGGPLHHHLANFKVDLDIEGTSNRYETLDFSAQTVPRTEEPRQQFQQIKFSRSLKERERDALYNFNFDTPKYHVVHNNDVNNKYNNMKAYRIESNGMSKQLLTKGQGNEPSIPWARHQMAVTKHKDGEFWSSSNYATWDSADPVVDFSQFYADNENITDEDLVFWISVGSHHLPHTEDLPVTTTVGKSLEFFLLPYNYFPQDPSMKSRDAIRVGYKNKTDPIQGLKIDRSGNSQTLCRLPKSTFDEEVEANPDGVVQTRNSAANF